MSAPAAADASRCSMPPKCRRRLERLRAACARTSPAASRRWHAPSKAPKTTLRPATRSTDDRVNARDAVIGISASGSAAFVVAAIERARETARTRSRSRAPRTRPFARAAETAIVLETGRRSARRLDPHESRNGAEDRAQRDLDGRHGPFGESLRQPDGRRRCVAIANCAPALLRLVRVIADVDEDRARELL